MLPLEGVECIVLNITIAAKLAGPFTIGQLPGGMLGFAAIISVNCNLLKSVLDHRGLTLHESLECKRTLPCIKGIFLQCGSRPIASVRSIVCTVALIARYRRPKPLLITSRPRDAIIIVIWRTGGLISLNAQVRKCQFDLTEIFPIELPFRH